MVYIHISLRVTMKYYYYAVIGGDRLKEQVQKEKQYLVAIRSVSNIWPVEN